MGIIPMNLSCNIPLPVSYTHLDVYKRQDMTLVTNKVRELERVPDLVVENWVE